MTKVFNLSQGVGDSTRQVRVTLGSLSGTLALEVVNDKIFGGIGGVNISSKDTLPPVYPRGLLGPLEADPS